MKVEVSTPDVEVWPGEPTVITVSVFNTGEVICGYDIELLGVDREWIRLDTDRLNLFPDDAAAVELVLELPEDFPAGRRNLAVVVRSALDSAEQRTVDIGLDVQATREARLAIEPVSFYGGRKARFGMVITNAGNSWTTMIPRVVEEEDKARISLSPDQVEIPPGEQATVTALVSRRRPFIGGPETRRLDFFVDGVDTPPQTVGTFTQRPIIGRGLLSLVGLLAALSVFGFVLTDSLSSLVDRTDSNDALLASALDEEQARLAAASADPSTLQGAVSLDSGAPAANVTVQLYDAEDGSVPLGAAATGPDGGFAFTPIVAGTYKVRVVGAGFVETWFPSAESFDDATPIDLAVGATSDPVDVVVVGRSATIQGAVLAEDPSEVTVSLVLLRGDTRVAVAHELVTDGSGTFVFDDVTPNVDEQGNLQPYELIAAKRGFAEERRLVTVSEGEIVEGIRVRLRNGDARLSGTVTLGGMTPTPDQLIEVTASADGDEYTTVTFGEGRFVFRDLPSPTLYSVTARRTGSTTETRSVPIDSGAAVSGIQIDLRPDTRTISGTTQATGGPVDGALVSVTDGRTSQTTRTDASGAFTFGDLSPQSTYTVTATADGFRSATVSCPPPDGCGPTSNVLVVLRPSTAPLYGAVCTQDGEAGPIVPLGGVLVELTSPTYSASTVSSHRVGPGVEVPPDAYGAGACTVDAADRAAGRVVGFYRFADVPRGTYTVTFTQTGGLPFTQVITVPTVGPVGQTLINTSSITITVLDGPDGSPVAGVEVTAYTQSQFAADPEGEGIGVIETGDDGVAAFTSIDAPEDYVVVARYSRIGDEQVQELSRSFPLRVGESKSETIVVDR